MPDVQVMTVRDSGNCSPGFFVAAKGGHNDESHNHNDVGQWILYRNGKPILIDVGVETYSKHTFGPERYGIWTMQSQYHNLPQVNGYGQCAGVTFRASDVRYHASPEHVSFSLDISEAYPQESGIVRWQRSIDFHRDELTDTSIEVTEEWELNGQRNELLLHYMTAVQPETIEPGYLLIASEPGHGVKVQYDANQLEYSVETIPVEDTKLKQVWGERLFRIQFEIKYPDTNGRLKLRFTP